MAATEHPKTSSAGDLLPEIAYLRSQVPFSPRQRCWLLDDGLVRASLPFDRLPAKYAVHEAALKRVLLLFAERNSTYYVLNLFNGFLHFARATQDVANAGGNIGLRELSHNRAGLKEKRYGASASSTYCFKNGSCSTCPA